MQFIRVEAIHNSTHALFFTERNYRAAKWQNDSVSPPRLDSLPHQAARTQRAMKNPSVPWRCGQSVRWCRESACTAAPSTPSKGPRREGGADPLLKSPRDRLVLAPLERARGVHEAAADWQQRRSLREEAELQRRQLQRGRLGAARPLLTPAQPGVSPNYAARAAGRVDERDVGWRRAATKVLPQELSIDVGLGAGHNVHLR